jgi:hypothetical protein
MTLKRHDNHSTEFGLWLREQPEIDSGQGFVATNLDYVWRNYKNNAWMIIEEKRYCSEPKRWQRDLFSLIDRCCKIDRNYRGFHLLQFEYTSPDDGRIWLDRKEITKAMLLSFLRFECVDVIKNEVA